MFEGRPIIGIAGGIGSGKSFVAALFAEFGCAVLSADDQARAAFADPDVLRALREGWGDAVFLPDGRVDRKALARTVFDHPDERRRLEALIHPRVAARRTQEMALAAADPAVRAFVWDVPLLFEVGLDKQCDAVVFVDVPEADRLDRVHRIRGWDRAELRRREKSQAPLDIKRRMSKYIVQNTADVGFARKQVEAVLSDILSQSAMVASPEPVTRPEPGPPVGGAGERRTPER